MSAHSSCRREKDIEFPAEIIFKAVFRNRSFTLESIKSVLGESGIFGDVNEKASEQGNFVSFTITAVYPSNEVLEKTCERISRLEGFMTLF